ncbi:Uncharacterised protein (plasmid) [Mesomycoplasma conjunctivae]|nr:Uncharacterised protein [Mesomycoplasma conjunctivae]VEU66777.1 Uncharacterised protein [Mesomycoplasma conjunctivae]
MQNTPKELTNDKEFLLQIIDTRPEVLEYVSDKLKNDNEIHFQAIKKNIKVLNSLQKY